MSGVASPGRVVSGKHMHKIMHNWVGLTLKIWQATNMLGQDV